MPSLESIDLVLEYAREEYHSLVQRHSDVVGRATTFLAFVAALIGLAGLMPSAGTTETCLVIAGIATLSLAALLGAAVAWLWPYSRAPQSEALKDLRNADPQETKRQIFFATLYAIADNKKRLRRVQFIYVAMVASVVVGAACIGAAAITHILHAR